MVATPEDENEKKVFADIEKYGSHVLNALEEDDLPGFSYSIGYWWKSRHPEILVIGLKKEVSHHILNAMGKEIRNGFIYEEGKRYSGLIEGFDCQFFKVNKKHYREYVGWARWFYEGDDFPLIQCVYPSTEGLYPWDEGASDWFRNWQPILSGNQPTLGRA